MKKNILFYILILLMAFLFVSCANGESTSETGENTHTPQLPKTEKLMFCDYTTANEYINFNGDKYAVKFTAENKLHSFDLFAFSSDISSRAIVTLYKWAGDYQTTVDSTPYDIYTLGPLGEKGSGIVNAMAFSNTKTPEAGEYLIVITSADDEASLLMGEKTDAAENNGAVCYKNGVEYDKMPCMTMAYHSSK